MLPITDYNSVNLPEVIQNAADGLLFFPGHYKIGVYFPYHNTPYGRAMAETVALCCKRAQVSLILSGSRGISEDTLKEVADLFRDCDFVLELDTCPRGFDAVSVLPAVVPQNDKLFHHLSVVVMKAFQNAESKSSEIHIYPDAFVHEDMKYRVPFYLSHACNIPSIHVDYLFSDEQLPHQRAVLGKALYRIAIDIKRLLPENPRKPLSE